MSNIITISNTNNCQEMSKLPVRSQKSGQSICLPHSPHLYLQREAGLVFCLFWKQKKPVLVSGADVVSVAEMAVRYHLDNVKYITG